MLFRSNGVCFSRCDACTNGEVIIPSGGDSLQPGDSAIVITTLTGLRDIQDILA